MKAVNEVSRQKYRKLIYEMPCGFAYFKVQRSGNKLDDQLILLDINPAFKKITGFPVNRVTGEKPAAIATGVAEPWLRFLRHCSGVANGGKSKCFDCYFIFSRRWGEVTVFSDERSYFAITIRDITGRKGLEEKLIGLNHRDSLTGLHNRDYFELYVERFNSWRELPLSMIMADLNGLKLVNDAFGHKRGDQMLRKAADILREACRREDIVIRWGGDEFILLLPRTPHKAALKIVNRINASCRSALVEKIPVSMALGLVTRNKPVTSLEEMLSEAGEKMYCHKDSHRWRMNRAVIKSILQTLAARSFETAKHTAIMQRLALGIGRAVGLPEAELKRLALLVAIHDIGKINVPREILTKAGPLNGSEWETMKKHLETGHRIALASECYASVAEDVFSHHERWDGTGYPRGLRGEAIPFLARIVSVVDAFEVMVSGRPYRRALSAGEAIIELQRCAGSQFDPRLVKVMLDVVKKKGHPYPPA